ncbi:MAG: mechanosensitive ion channel family protein [Balneolaceae bacterium]
MNIHVLMQPVQNLLHTFLDNIETLILVAAILLMTGTLAWIIKRGFNRFIERSSGEMAVDPTNYKFMQHALVGLVYVTGISFAIYLIPPLSHIAGSLIAGAGILAVAVGFASQQALGNIISGLFIVIYKPYRINDRVTIRTDLRGVVEDINLRHTIIRNFENQRIIIPNSLIGNEVLVNSNYLDVMICRFIEVGVSYTSDVDRAKEIMAEEILNHPENIDTRKPKDIEEGVPPVTVRLITLSDSSVILRGWAWAADAHKAFVMGCDLLESIKKRFDTEGIVIPFPQRTISYLNGGDSAQGAGQGTAGDRKEAEL